ncbi:putative glycosyltransferase [Sphingobium sp. SYK-6]|uniref:glycosyltransferase family 4 protein n=1 Tax=Sphingobium sp. (strain NBRC 103272 / SYK-6) TaxID=627192 RepID=UPI00022776C1|nr:glycosyltransferase family 4 protein [Sphingobium sp. SYK-6]BAK67896.1 putative glycosyltransferase [Sphingobium sp. SYK-6]
MIGAALCKAGRTGPIRILQLHGTFDQGGKEARVVRLMNHWGARASHDLLIGDPDATGARAGIDSQVPVRFLFSPPLFGPPLPPRYMALARAMQGYDLILSFNWGAMDGVMAHRLFHLVKRLPPLIHHEDGFNEDEANTRSEFRNRYRRIALGSAHALVVPSNQLARIAQREWHQSAGKVRQIPNGIDVASYQGKRPATAIPGLVPDGRLIVGTLAGLRPVKNLRRLVRAVAPLRDRVRLVIVGEGEEREAILAEAAALGMDDMLLPGFLPRPQDYVGAFDIFALSSDSEQFPISLAEAMSAGLPVVATDVGDISAMVSASNRPFIVALDDPGDFTAALSELAADADLRARIGEANRARAMQCFDETVMFQLYARLYGGAIRDELALI